MTRSNPPVRLAGTLAAAVALVLWLMPAAASAQVHDNAHLFTAQAITDADAAIAQMQRKHNKGLVVETFASVPVEQKDPARKDKRAFFKHWSTERFNATGANGVYALICMDPKYLEVRCGPETEKRGDFTEADVARLSAALKADLGANRNDDALAGGVDLVERAYTANIGGSAPAPRSAAGEGTPAPAQSYPAVPSGNTSHSSGGFGLGGLICAVVGAVIIFSLIKSAFGNRNNQGGGFGGNMGGGTGFGGVGGGGGSYPTGGPSYGPGYGPGYGAPPRSGGGFGSGFLGGLLGGAVGGYAIDKFEHRDDPSSNAGFTGGGDSGGSFGGAGGGTPGYDSGPSDAGQLTDDNGGDAGGDFGCGGDSGGGGGDFGGDSGGGGGGDSGGGDSGGSF